MKTEEIVNIDKENPPALDIRDPFSIENVPAASLDTINPKVLTEMNYILRDLLAGDSGTLDRPEFRGLNVSQIKAALDFILSDRELSPLQKSDLLSNSWRVNYRDKPPSPAEFLTEKYLGPVAGTIFPHIKDTFIEYLDPTKPYRTCVLYPHIGWGKSYLAVLVNLFVGVHMAMMRAPWRFFGQSPATIYTQVFAAVSLKKSSELLFEPLLNMIESAEFFEKVHTKEGMAKREKDFSRMNNIDRIFWTTAVPTSAIQFSNGANFKLISNPNGLLGQTIVMGTMTELTFFYEAGKSEEQVYKFFTKLRGRIESRMKGNYFGRFVLDSSPNTLESIIDDWIVNTAPRNPTNYIIKGSRWKWVPSDFPEDFFDENMQLKPEKSFQVFIGGKGRPPQFIDPESRPEYAPEDVIDVPDTFLMRGAFEENLYEALKDQAGIPAGSSDKIFYDYQKIENIFEPKLRSIYTHIVAMSTDAPEDLIWNQLKDQFFVKVLNKYQFWYKPHIPRVFAVDQSISGDVTAIVIAHVEREIIPATAEAPEQSQAIYVIDMIVPITPKGGRINLDAIRYFITDLREKGGLLLTHGSFDQFQSEATMQYLKRRGFEIEKLSVDKVMDPYLNFVAIVESGRLRAGRNLHLKNNLKSLQIVRRRGADGSKSGSRKIDHTLGEIIHEGNTTWEMSGIGQHAKDVADAAAACCELIRKHNMLPYEVWCPDKIVEKNREQSYDDVKSFLLKKGLSI
jgi:hypothetical protein